MAALTLRWDGAGMTTEPRPCQWCGGRGKLLGEHGMGCGPTCDRPHWRGTCTHCNGTGEQK